MKINSVFSYLKSKRITTVAGAWVFYFLLAFVPLVFFIVSASNMAGVDFSSLIVKYLPEEFKIAGETVLETAEKVSNGVAIFFAVTCVFSATTLLNQMSVDGDYIFGEKRKGKSYLRRLFSLIALAVLYCIFLGLAILVGVLDSTVKKLISDNNVILTVCAFSLIIITCFLIILILNKFICPVKVKWSVSFIGAFVSLIIIVLGTIGLILYLNFFNNYNAFYGSLAGIVIFLIWSYIIMLGLVIGSVLSASLYKKYGNA